MKKYLFKIFITSLVILGVITLGLVKKETVVKAEVELEQAVLNTTDYDVDGDGEKDPVYEISNASQLYWFAKLCNDYVDFDDPNKTISFEGYYDTEWECHVYYNAILMNDIILNENVIVNGELNPEYELFTQWVPICNVEAGDSYSPKTSLYSGVFDGNGYTISGLYLNDTTLTDQAMFNCVGEKGIVKNLTLSDTYVSVKNSSAGLIGNNFGTLYNCSLDGLIFSQEYYAGGLVVSNRDTGIIENSSNFANVKSNRHLNAGIATTNSGVIKNSYNLGIIGSEESYQCGGISGNNNGLIENCYNGNKVIGRNSLGGITFSNYDGGNIKNSYHNIDLFSGNTYFWSSKSTIDEVSGGKTTEQFESGEITYLLNKGIVDGTQIYYQTLGTANNPEFVGETVYYGYSTCLENEKAYTNNIVYETLNETHILTHYEAKEVTCFESGLLEHNHCNVCKKNFDNEYNVLDEVIIESCYDKGYVILVKRTSPTLTSEGNETYYYCENCDKKFDLNYKEFDPTIERLHEYGEWIIDKEATTEEEGHAHRICSECGKVEEKVLPVRNSSNGDCKAVSTTQLITYLGFALSIVAFALFRKRG